MKRPASGFTLLEMLFALVLLAVLMALLGTALLGANRAALKGEHYGQRLEAVRASQNFLHHALEGALPVELPAEGEQPRVFDGQRQRLVFAAGLNSALGGGLQVHTLELVGLGGHQALQVRFEQLLRGVARPWGQPQVLLEDVRDLRLSYRGRDDRGQPTAWLPRWPWPARLPQAVRIELDSAGPVPWVAQVVALRLDLSETQGAP
ncbi:prepilin-type N-terminal cleavage/methylation domain-containing protein [Pseudomonas silvicola]|nr:prepilin-type N-terminal cleavage/methylation domain-containing protein [Pseudomonas silvicola]